MRQRARRVKGMCLLVDYMYIPNHNSRTQCYQQNMLLLALTCWARGYEAISVCPEALCSHFSSPQDGRVYAAISFFSKAAGCTKPFHFSHTGTGYVAISVLRELHSHFSFSWMVGIVTYLPLPPIMHAHFVPVWS